MRGSEAFCSALHWTCVCNVSAGGLDIALSTCMLSFAQAKNSTRNWHVSFTTLYTKASHYMCTPLWALCATTEMCSIGASKPTGIIHVVLTGSRPVPFLFYVLFPHDYDSCMMMNAIFASRPRCCRSIKSNAWLPGSFFSMHQWRRCGAT